jgi:Type I phosphodiesterase / nucleotide pyrophosphatase
MKRLPIVVLVALLVAGSAYFVVTRPEPDSPAEKLEPAARTFDTNDPVERGCLLSEKILLRAWRGDYLPRAPDLTMVPQHPNFSGGFETVNHSGPWDYLTNVPLVFYGPRIESAGRLEEPASLVDVYSTVGKLVDVDLPPRDGKPLDAALKPERDGVPKVIVTVVWDGVGRNVLEEWPNRWPFLASMEREGTSYVDASVGSSPTITPSTHSNLGTGTYPRKHGVTGIYYREEGTGAVVDAFHGRDMSGLRQTTFGDDIDQAYDNLPLVGVLASRSWHMSMLSHGAALPGGDEDQAALFRETLVGTEGDEVLPSNAGFETPDSLANTDWSRLEEYADELDREDGKADGKWLGHPVLAEELHDNPAWVKHQTDAIIHMLREEGYGTDDVPDLFFTNLKYADTVGHYYIMDSKEMGFVLEALDDGLRRISEYLDATVGDYVLILTADHGHTPPAQRTGGWPITNGRVVEDIDEHFKMPQGRSLIENSVAVGLFLNADTMREFDVTAEEVAEFLNGYTIEDNSPSDVVPEDYADRADEPVFSAVWTKNQLDEILECKFGSPRPPRDLDA